MTRHTILFVGVVACSSGQMVVEPTPSVSDGTDAMAPELGETGEAWSPWMPVPPDGGSPPLGSSCETEAGLCALPESKCVDGWLVYWSNGRCIDRACRYDTHFMWCPSGCIQGACYTPHPTQ